MASPPPPPAKKPSQLHPTTMTDLDDDNLREIFLRLPSLPSLVRAALSCRAFLDAVRSPAFRLQFRALHPPPLLGLFLGIQYTVTPTFVPLLRRSDPDTAAAVRGADFFLTRLPVSEDDKEDAGPGPWSIGACHDGFVVLDNWSSRQVAVYNPLRRTMDLFPLPPHRDDCEGLHFDYHILAEEEDCRSSYRVMCVWHGERGARADVLSSDTKEVAGLPMDKHRWVLASAWQAGEWLHLLDRW
ncbi:unnamed protein product [Triticum turgidum subsp. durum]|uniref:F-box domain-containing protein n=1 Tax=Triticum turgidum subsp. durum TaxID=4567 RepID=A0A9R1Q5I3_TRITD|nr:unnamed protein product [Triticum turgidum subsp. durum]